MKITGLQTNFTGLMKSVSTLFLSLILFSGCVNDLEQPAQAPSAFVSIYHGSPDGPDLDIYAESKKINNQPLLFGQSFPYSGFFAGERRLRFNPFNAQNTLLEKNVTLLQDKIYTVFLVNKAADIDAIQVEDIWEEPDGLKTQMRLVHLSPDSGDLEVSIAEQTPFGPSTTYLSISDFLELEKGKVKVEVDGMQKGKYVLEVYKVGYKVNDVYAYYLALNKPNQLTREQVNAMKKKNNGDPIATEKITIDAKGTFSREFKINENDVVFLNLVKQ